LSKAAHGSATTPAASAPTHRCLIRVVASVDIVAAHHLIVEVIESAMTAEISVATTTTTTTLEVRVAVALKYACIASEVSAVILKSKQKIKLKFNYALLNSKC
jgi:hypothetical protein